MPKTEDSKDASSSKKRSMFDKFSAGERRTMLLIIVVVLIVVAVALLFRSQSSDTLAACKSILFEVQKNQCLSSLAASTHNLSICRLVSSPGSTAGCIDSIAEGTKNISACSSLGTGSAVYTGCIDNISYSLDNPADCGLLGNGSQSASTCTYNIAVLDGFSNLGTCSSIANSSEESMCTSLYYYNLAKRRIAPNYCSELPNSTDNNLLTAMISDTYANSSTGLAYYSLYNLNTTPSSLCYYVLATDSRNESLCSSTSGSISDLCYSNFTSASANQSTNLNTSALCSTEPGYAQGLCTYSISTAKALAQDNVSICSAINGTYYQYSCVVSVATKYGNSTYCSAIVGNDTAESACVISANEGLSNTTAG